MFVSAPSARLRSEILHDPSSAYRRLIREVSTEFDARLQSARQVEPVRGFGGHLGFIKRSTGEGWALVGDAGYFKDPLTAHGITDALRDAELLARAILTGTPAGLAGYETTRLDLSRRLFEITDEIASFGWTDDEVQLLHRAFSSEMSREVRALAALDPVDRTNRSPSNASRRALTSTLPAGLPIGQDAGDNRGAVLTSAPIPSGGSMLRCLIAVFVLLASLSALSGCPEQSHRHCDAAGARTRELRGARDRRSHDSGDRQEPARHPEHEGGRGRPRATTAR